LRHRLVRQHQLRRLPQTLHRAHEQIERRDIVIEAHVFIGSHSFVKGGAHIGHHSVVAAGTIVGPGAIPPYSLIAGNPMRVKPGYYRAHLLAQSDR
jgi:acetyltransferase-like isoleucine patch superfamily enzyme